MVMYIEIKKINWLKTGKDNLVAVSIIPVFKNIYLDFKVY